MVDSGFAGFAGLNGSFHNGSTKKGGREAEVLPSGQN